MSSRMRPRERPHPAPVEYVKIAIILAIVTALEVAIIYTPARKTPGLVVPVLLVLSGLKFALVALWFMHLKFDSRLFSSLFFGGLALIGAILIALLALFRVFSGG